ncbi:protoheme IX farnesyltransferase [Buchnera aphidicola]|uniref:Protoheme IX farnesyltransferase n=1 Tax=Buchnera aphidicola (Cinara strobi) TaxID=1921549 RepID=A0A3B1E7Z2_9GAMM|nr:protoheme IX farnesyltransferase [Buchnera aphidicola]VAX76727.1 Protoheme IX farnesyltransferase [Buchnera aphidicola (Cinara strobi)]
MDFRSFKSLKLKNFFIFDKYKIIKMVELIKPGIIFGNLISLSGGFFLASKGSILILLFLKTILGMIFIISSSCIFNNIIDRDLDRKMHRTNNRILCTNCSSNFLKLLFFFSLFLFFLGLYIFFTYINSLCAYISFLGVFIYVILYSLFFKRYSSYSTIIGSISGSLPPIIGYIAVNNFFNKCCLILFFIFIFWQISHSYSIMIYRFKDYKIAKIPTFFSIFGIKYTIYCISWCIVFIFFLNFLLYFFYYVNFFYFFYTSIFIFLWFIFSIIKNILFLSLKYWSRCMFFISIFIVFFMSIFVFFSFL